MVGDRKGDVDFAIEGKQKMFAMIRAGPLTLGACAREVTVIIMSVCYQSSARNKMNLPDRSSLNSEGLLTGDLAKKLSFPSYSLCFLFRTGGHFQLPVLTTRLRPTTIT